MKQNFNDDLQGSNKQMFNADTMSLQGNEQSEPYGTKNKKVVVNGEPITIRYRGFATGEPYNVHKLRYGQSFDQDFLVFIDGKTYTAVRHWTNKRRLYRALDNNGISVSSEKKLAELILSMQDNGLQGAKKADSKADDFFMEIKISKNSLPNSSELQAATGSLRGFLRAAKIAACPSKRQPLAGSATPTPRVVANIKDIQDSINIFDEKIKNWEKSPITDEYAFLLYILTKLPHETSKNQSYYVIEENGNFRIRFSFHNALAKYLNKNEKYKIGITFQSKDTPITFEPIYNVYYKEHVYYTEYLASEVLCNILQGIVNVLKGEYYTIPCDKELYSPTKEKYIEHFGLQGLDYNEQNHELGSFAADPDEIDASKISWRYDKENDTSADVQNIINQAKEAANRERRLRLAKAKAKATELYDYAQSNTLRGKDTPKRGDVYTLPKSWARHDAWLSNDEKDAYDFYSVANVSGDKVTVINESLMVTSFYTLENFKKMGFKFHHHEDKYGTIGGVDGTATDSVSVGFNKKIMLYKRGHYTNPQTQIYVCETPDFWKKKGLSTGSIKLPISVIDKAITKHELLIEHFINFPDELRNENDLFLSKTERDAYVQLTELRDYKNHPIVVAIHLKKIKNGYAIYKIASVHGKFERQIEKWRAAGLCI